MVQLPWPSVLRKSTYKVLVDNVGLNLCLLGTSNFMVTMTFSSLVQLQWSQDEFNNQSQIYKTLGRLHDPWCKQPLNEHTIAKDHNNTSHWLKLRGVYVNSSSMFNIDFSLQDHRRWSIFQGKFDTFLFRFWVNCHTSLSYQSKSLQYPSKNISAPSAKHAYYHWQ